MKNEPLLLPGKVSGINKNQCPICAGIAVRNQQESVSALRKNHCPDWTGISVRIGQEYALKSQNKSLLRYCVNKFQATANYNRY